jgi:hypothetical protein
MAQERPTHVPPTPTDPDTDLITFGEFGWCFKEGCGLPVGQWLDAFEVFTWLEFGGDTEKATAHIAAVGYGGGQTPIVSPRTGRG